MACVGRFYKEHNNNRNLSGFTYEFPSQNISEIIRNENREVLKFFKRYLRESLHMKRFFLPLGPLSTIYMLGFSANAVLAIFTMVLIYTFITHVFYILKILHLNRTLLADDLEKPKSEFKIKMDKLKKKLMPILNFCLGKDVVDRMSSALHKLLFGDPLPLTLIVAAVIILTAYSCL